jgi:hypothetical protein
MRYTRTDGISPHRGRAWLGLAAVAVLVPIAAALPPLVPLPLPAFSLDPNSPSVIGGLVGPADVLTIGPGGLEIAIPGGALGLYLPGDDLDALSADNSPVEYTQTFALLFSVDRETVGAAVVDTILIGLGVPYNVADQAARGHAAGDEYMALTLHTLAGRSAVGTRGTGATLVRNNYDEGGTDFSAIPPTHADDTPGPVPQDDVDATAQPRTATTRGQLVDVYFSANTGSPSLPVLSTSLGQMPSGAHIFFNADPLVRTQTALYASYGMLGLQQGDDIDALIVFDLNENHIFDIPDVVLFSLDRYSPSLTSIPGTSQYCPAADVFIAHPGMAPQVFAPASEFGLGTLTDNINALDFVPCLEPQECARVHGIRSIKGDLNCDGVADVFDIDAFVLALTDPTAYQALHPDCNIENADCNLDHAIDVFDIDCLVDLITGP